tara:strand:+ start:580 stop:1050 length:471 start_codon:yes stop_codon:yes gene_type:complete
MISHLNKKNKPKIVDISSKKITSREAIAESIIKFSKSTFKKINSFKTKKGEIKSVAIIAGILAAKKTSDLIPLCHNIKIDNIDIDIKTMDKTNSLKITSFVKTTEKTGVEIEALTAVVISSLTIYDMCKSIDKNITIKNIRLIEKKGGKTDYKNNK